MWHLCGHAMCMLLGKLYVVLRVLRTVHSCVDSLCQVQMFVDVPVIGFETSLPYSSKSCSELLLLVALFCPLVHAPFRFRLPVARCHLYELLLPRT